MSATTLVERFIELRNVDDRGITFLYGEDDECYVPYCKFYSDAMNMLGYLQKKGLKPSDELVLQIEDNDLLSFLTVCWGCILGGIIAVPVSVGGSDEQRRQFFLIWCTLQHPYLITTVQNLNRLRTYVAGSPNADIFPVLEERTILLNDGVEDTQATVIHKVVASDVAFIQFSSGSTGRPKGVILTHDNLMVNTRAINQGFDTQPSDSFFNWLPLTHSFGLISFHLTPVVAGIQHYLMPTSLFIRCPTLWMKKISEYHANMTCSPNFGYKYFLSRFDSEASVGLDLSSVKIIVNGSEPISAELVDEFYNRMEQYGLKRTTMIMSYGMTEATVGISSGRYNFSPIYLDRYRVKVGEPIVEVPKERREAIAFVDEGVAFQGCQIRICDDEDRILGERIVGHIQINGRNVIQGYYNDPIATAELRSADGWVRTGDIGFMNNGRLVMAGRMKDIIFVNGHNVYPHDIDRIAMELPSIEWNQEVASCGVANPETRSEDIIVFVQFEQELEQFVQLSREIRRHIAECAGWKIKDVIPIRQIPKTANGKIQRYKLAEQYRDGEYAALSEQLRLLIDKECSHDFLDQTSSVDEVASELLQIFRRGLLSENIQLYDRYFENGVTSIQLMVIIGELKTSFGIRLEIADFFACPTILMLAEYVCKSERISIPGKSARRMMAGHGDF